MNSLATRLSLAIVVVVLLVVTLVSILVARATNQAFRGYLARSLQPTATEIQQVLTEYYRTHGTWRGVVSVLRPYRRNLPPQGAPPLLIVTDERGQVVVGTPRIPVGRGIPRTLRSFATPIIVDGKTVGFLILLPPGSQGERLPRAEETFLSQIQRSLLFVALLAVALGILMSVITTYTITAPLKKLVDAARSVGAGQFRHRVDIQGPEEVASVARAFNEMAAALEASEERQRQLLADIAHELRTPLSVLQANLRAMLDGVFPLNPKEIAALYDEARLISRLVDDLRDLALADMGRLPLDMAQVDVRPLVQQTVTTFALAAEAKDIRVDVDLPDAAVYVQVDPDRLAQVLRNLLSNALRHTPAGGTITVRVLLVEEDVPRARIEVTDTGPGIPPEQRAHVFDRFWRADPSRARESGGSGLGLAIARSLVEAMGGTIGVESEVGRGSTFWVEFPLLPRSQVPLQHEPQKEE